MKNLLVISCAVVLSLLLVQSAFAQAAAQTVNLSVSKVYRIAIAPAGAISMNISTGSAGTDQLDDATDANTGYAVTQNNSAATKITAGLSGAMAKGKLFITLAAGLGSSAGEIELTDGVAKNVVTGMALGAYSGPVGSIAYRFRALASEGTFSDVANVTLTVVD